MRNDHDAAKSEKLKQQAFQFVEANRETFVLKARRCLLTEALRLGRVTIDDVREIVPLPAGVNPKTFGCVPTPLANAGIIGFAGFGKTARKVAHARRNVIWEMKDAAAAKRWLTSHPDPDDSTPPSTTSEG